jgi:hypothetical protein
MNSFSLNTDRTGSTVGDGGEEREAGIFISVTRFVRVGKVLSSCVSCVWERMFGKILQILLPYRPQDLSKAADCGEVILC